MNRFLLLSILLTLALSVMAQATWSLELEAYAGLSGTNEGENTFGMVSSTVAFEHDWQENLYLSRGAGVVIGYRLSHDWELQAGLAFRQLGTLANLSYREYSVETPQQTNQSTEFRLSQRQFAPSISARYFFLDEHSRVQPFLSFGGQAARLLNFSLSSRMVEERVVQRNNDVFAREEVTTGNETQQTTNWNFNWFTAIGLRWNRFSVRLQYDWEAFPQTSLFSVDQVGYPHRCYSCQLSERAQLPQLRQTSLRFSYRFL